MLIKAAGDLRWSDVTPKALYLRRREFIQAAGIALVGGAAGLVSPREARAAGQGRQAAEREEGRLGQGETLTPYEAVTTYNNFYELGVDKDDPSRNAGLAQAAPLDGVD